MLAEKKINSLKNLKTHQVTILKVGLATNYGATNPNN